MLEYGKTSNVSLQAWLYIQFPLSELQFKKPVCGRQRVGAESGYAAL